jgi:hypothetical protein
MNPTTNGRGSAISCVKLASSDGVELTFHKILVTDNNITKTFSRVLESAYKAIAAAGKPMRISHNDVTSPTILIGGYMQVVVCEHHGLRWNVQNKETIPLISAWPWITWWSDLAYWAGRT